VGEVEDEGEMEDRWEGWTEEVKSEEKASAVDVDASSSDSAIVVGAASSLVIVFSP